MKKCLLLIFTVCIMLGLGVGLTSCGSKHTHACSEWTEVVDATCTAQGHRRGKCDTCGEEFTEIIEILPHSFDEWKITIIADCQTEGKEERMCEVCEYKEEKIIDKTAHDEVAVIGYPATCEGNGLSDGTRCTVCEQMVVEQQTIPAKGHTWGQWNIVEEATCSEEGQKERDCENCTKSEVQDIPLIDHNYGQWQIEKDSSCVETGLKYRICTMCNSARENDIIQKKDHQFEEDGWVTDEEATCTSQGTEINVCTLCHKEALKRLTSKKDHTIEILQKVEPTCDNTGLTEGQKCSVCQTELVPQREIPANGHKWGKWIKDESAPGKHKRICDTDNTHIEQQLCVYSKEITIEPTCTEGGRTYKTCQECFDEVTLSTRDKLNHSYGSWTAVIVEGGESSEHIHKHYRDCTRCNDISAREEDECDMQLQEVHTADCTTAPYNESKCTECGSIHEEITGEALGHMLEYEWGMESFSISRHRQVCKRGGCDYKTSYQQCTLQLSRTAATCTDNIYVIYTCLICEHQRKIEEQNTKLGHKFGAFVFCGDRDHPQHKHTCEREECGEEEFFDCQMDRVENAATCEQNGTVKETCKYCFHTFTSDGEVSLGHQWTNWANVDGTGNHTRKCEKCKTVETKEHQLEITNFSDATCTTPEYTTKTCKDCSYEIIEESAPATGHAWKVDGFSDDRHKGICNVCLAQADGEHDWSESNLCSVCGYDGLTYHIEGIHCYVENDDRVPNAKRIVINEKHKVLGEDGNYEKTEYTVTSIASSAFSRNLSITSVVLPSSLKTICGYAFINCANLVTVEIEGDNSVLEKIEYLAFDSCKSLTTFEIPESLVTIEYSAFSNCSSLNNINVGENVKEIGADAFRNTAYVKDDNNWIDGVLYVGNHLIDAKRTKQVENEDGSITNVIDVRDGTISIAYLAFKDCKDLEKIILPEALVYIGRDVFKECKNISQVEYKGDLHGWLNIEFVNDFSSPLCYGKTGLHIANAHDSIDLSDTKITRIPAGTFRGTKITSVILPETITYIGEDAFEDCNLLKTITINGKVTYVGENAFKGTAFFEDDENWDEDGVLYLAGILIKARATLTGAYVVKDNTITIADKAFEGCSNLEEITLNREIERVGADAFLGCDGLTKVTFTDTTYLWMVTIKDSISRGFEGERLNWNTLKAYNGGWRRVQK